MSIQYRMSQRRLSPGREDTEDELEDGEDPGRTPTEMRRNFWAFWLLGLCNNFAYVIMLSSAKDILEGGSPSQNGTETVCREHIDSRLCHPLSTGSVLLADIVPALIVKVTAPFYIHHFPFGLRHVVVVILQAGSFLMVAFSTSIPMGLAGVSLASFGSGLGEITYLSLASHFNVRTISFWSSGTGGAGIFGALTYALFTDKKLLAISPRHTLLSMLTIPVVFSVAYFVVLHLPPTVYRLQIHRIQSYIVPPSHVASLAQIRRNSDSEEEAPLLAEELVHHPNKGISQLFKYIVPLVTVYFGEYFINQGLTELLEFDCSHGWNLDPASQYRWYQVLYQLGVFISRSSSDFYTIQSSLLPILAALQLLNAGLFLVDVIEYFIPHVVIVFLLIFYEGLLGGSAYVNTFRAIHDEIPPERREFSMCVVSISDTLGIVISGISAIPVHNWVCSKPL